MAGNIFEKIIRREIPADIVYEDDEILAFKDIHPAAPVHILIVPKKSILNVSALRDEDVLLIGKLHLVARDLAREWGIEEEGYRILTNVGSNGGQEVPHLHFHLLGGKSLGSKICS